jgi:hypothetical protein
MKSNRGGLRALSLRPARALALALALAAQSASGQTPAAPAAPADPVVLPKPDCGAKPEHPGRLGSDARQRQWSKDANAYLECFKAYAMNQRARALEYSNAANALIDEYNAAVKEMQAAAAAAAQ